MAVAVDFLKAFDAVTLGEDSGGKPNHYGEMQRFVLPRTHLVVSCSTRYFSLVDGDPPSLKPDRQVPVYMQDYLQGRDPLMDALQ